MKRLALRLRAAEICDANLDNVAGGLALSQNHQLFAHGVSFADGAPHFDTSHSGSGVRVDVAVSDGPAVTAASGTPTVPAIGWGAGAGSHGPAAYGVSGPSVHGVGWSPTSSIDGTHGMPQSLPGVTSVSVGGTTGGTTYDRFGAHDRPVTDVNANGFATDPLHTPVAPTVGVGVAPTMPVAAPAVGVVAHDPILPAVTPVAPAVTPVAHTPTVHVGTAADVWLQVDYSNQSISPESPLLRGGVVGTQPPGFVPPGFVGSNGGGGGGLFSFFGDEDPLLLDLNGTGVRLTSVQDGVQFDINGDGIREQVAWTQALGADTNAWLVRDDSHDGGQAGIQSGLELFGDQHGDANGFSRLAQFDDNHDGVFNAQDRAFNEMQLWQDLNHDGLSQANELASLADRGVTSIDITPNAPMGTMQDGTRIQNGTFTRTV